MVDMLKVKDAVIVVVLMIALTILPGVTLGIIHTFIFDMGELFIAYIMAIYICIILIVATVIK